MLKIICDTRERNPYTFKLHPEVIREVGTLATGDYSLAGFTDRVAVERKEVSDLIGCLTHDRKRFTRELERLRGYEAAAVVVEAPFSTIQSGMYHSRLSADSAVQSIVSIMANYRMPFYFAPSRMDAERFVKDFIRHFYRHTMKRLEILQKHQTAAER